MALLPDFRGRGFGERLLRSVLDASWSFGFEKVELAVFTSNPRAEALYRKVGFVEEGVRKRSMKFADGYRDERLMAMFKQTSPARLMTGMSLE
jgi:RimJ/RimL family protein N-acetyltransferase